MFDTLLPLVCLFFVKYRLWQNSIIEKEQMPNRWPLCLVQVIAIRGLHPIGKFVL
jgi:hypothetical protein